MSLSLSDSCLQISPSVTLAIDARAKQLRAQGVDVIGFGAGEPDFDTPLFIRQAAQRAMDQGQTRYTPVAGTLQLRRQIAEKLQQDNGLSFSPDQIMVSNGAKQALYVTLCALLNPGDEVLIPSPCWVSYPEMVRMAGGVPVFVPGHEQDNFLVTAGMLAAYITPRTKALLLNSPNNPCGCVYPEEMLRDIAQLAVEKQFYVISDEIYEKLVYGGEKHLSIASLSDQIGRQTIVVNGLSKTYAMTGWRVGYAAGPQPVIRAMCAVQSHISGNANSIAQAAAAEALAGGQQEISRMTAEFSHRRELIHRLINQIDGLSAPLPQGAFYLMVNISALTGRTIQGCRIDCSESFADMLLEKAHVAVVPCKAFGSDRHVRLSYAISCEQIREGVRRIADCLTE